jgi:hypothetical protein
VRRGLHVSCLCAAALLAAPRLVQAEAMPQIVRVYVAGSPEAVAGSRDAVQELCARSNVAVIVHDAAGADEALLATSSARSLAEAYVDLRPGMPTRVVVVDGESHRDLERRTLPDKSSLEMSIETVAHVVCAAVESSLAARATGSSRTDEGARPVASRAERGATRSLWEPRVTVFAATENFGAGFRGGIGGSLALSAGRARIRPGAVVSISGFPAMELEAAGGLASLGTLSLRLLPALEWHATSGVIAFVAAGGGIDRFVFDSESAPAATIAREPGATVDGIAAGMLGLRLQFGRGVGVLFALDADVDLLRHVYVIETSQGRSAFFEPSRLRPVALAGLSISLGGLSEPAGRNQTEARR